MNDYFLDFLRQLYKTLNTERLTGLLSGSKKFPSNLWSFNLSQILLTLSRQSSCGLTRCFHKPLTPLIKAHIKRLFHHWMFCYFHISYLFYLWQNGTNVHHKPLHVNLSAISPSIHRSNHLLMHKIRFQAFHQQCNMFITNYSKKTINNPTTRKYFNCKRQLYTYRVRSAHFLHSNKALCENKRVCRKQCCFKLC